MRRIIFKQSLNKRLILMTFFILCSLFISENTFSVNQWQRDYVTVRHFSDNVNMISLRFKFFDFEFGPNKEHAYLEWCHFEYSIDGLAYNTLAVSEAKDHVYYGWMWVYMTHKLTGATIKLHGGMIPKADIMWEDSKDYWLAVRPHGSGGYLALQWYLKDNVTIKKFRITGKWSVRGLYCPDYIKGEIYEPTPVQTSTSFNSVLNLDIKTELNQNFMATQPENNAVKVFSVADAVFVNRAGHGKNILIYTTSGVLVKSMIAASDVVEINLPANQSYIVNVGQARFKVNL